MRIPTDLRLLYSTVGEVPMFMRSFQRFLPPEQWSIQDDRLLFLEENQGVCEWACDTSEAVWQSIPTETGTGWHAESLALCDFLQVVLPYQLAQGGWPFAGMGYIAAKQWSQALAELANRLGWPLIVQHNGLFIYSAGASMLRALEPTPERDTAMVFISSREKQEFKRLLKQLAFKEL